MTIKSLDLREEVVEELAFDPQVTSDDVAVTARDGVVTLRGTVPNFFQKWQAVEAVKRVRGVRGVADELTVDLPSMHKRDDTDIALAIEHRMASNSLLPPAIAFVVKDGHVTLSGEVTWQYQAQEAAHETRRVVGVRDVINLITIKARNGPDADEIKRRIHGEFQRMADFDAKGVDVAISGGAVTLSGSVRTWPEWDRASGVAWSLPGVTSVKNLIGVAC